MSFCSTLQSLLSLQDSINLFTLLVRASLSYLNFLYTYQYIHIVPRSQFVLTPSIFGPFFSMYTTCSLHTGVLRFCLPPSHIITTRILGFQALGFHVFGIRMLMLRNLGVCCIGSCIYRATLGVSVRGILFVDTIPSLRRRAISPNSSLLKSLSQVLPASFSGPKSGTRFRGRPMRSSLCALHAAEKMYPVTRYVL